MAICRNRGFGLAHRARGSRLRPGRDGGHGRGRFVNAGRAPVDRTDFFVGVQTEQGLLTSNVRSYAVPSGYGVITEWSHFAGSASGPLGFGVMRRFPDGEYTQHATAVRRVTAGQLHRFATRMPVRRGDQLVLASENQGGQPRLRLFYLGGLRTTVSELTDYNVGNGQPRPEEDARPPARRRRACGDRCRRRRLWRRHPGCLPHPGRMQVACPDGGQDAGEAEDRAADAEAHGLPDGGFGQGVRATGRDRPVGTQGEFVASEGGSLRFRVTSRTGRRVGGSFTVDATARPERVRLLRERRWPQARAGQLSPGGRGQRQGRQHDGPAALAFRIVP